MKDKQSAWVDVTQNLPDEQECILVCLKLPKDGKQGLYDLAIYRNKGNEQGFHSLAPALWTTGYSSAPKPIAGPERVI